MEPFAAIIPPYAASACVLTVAAALALRSGLARHGQRFLPYLPGVVYVAAWALVFWALAVAALQRLRVPALLVMGLALAGHAVLTRRDSGVPGDAAPASVRIARLYLAAALLLAALLLLPGLGTYCGALQTWETTVVGGFPETGGFAAAFLSGQGILNYAAQRVVWDDGVLSAGNTSLFYGAPAYGLFHLLGFSAWTLRLPAVIATLCCVLVAYAMARRFFGPLVGAAAAMAFGLNCCVLFYGRYGSSPAGTLLSVLLALWCTWLFLDADRPPWWLTVLCAASLFAATLQYSTARIMVVVLMGFIAAVLALRWRRLTRQQIAGGLGLAVAAVAVWVFESAHEAQHAFVMARGEQYFQMLETPDRLTELFGQRLLDRDLTSDTLSMADAGEVLYRMVQTTLPQLYGLLRPTLQLDRLTDIDYLGRLPQLYYAPVVVFILWGLVHSLLRLRSWPHASLLVLMIGSAVPLLLTNRVDTHRSMLLVIPLSLWAALGVWEAARLMARAGVPRLAQHACAAAFVLTVVYSDVFLLHREPAPDIPAARAIVAEAAAVRGPLAVGAELDDRELGWILLDLLERTRRAPEQQGTLLSRLLVRGLEDPGPPADADLRHLRELAAQQTVLLAPADRFHTVAADLRGRGVRVTETGPAGARMLRLEAEPALSGHRPSDTIAVTHSTCSVCGSMSNGCT